MMTRYLTAMSLVMVASVLVVEARGETQTDREKAGLRGTVLTVVENSAGSDQTVITAYGSKGSEEEQTIYSSVNYVRRTHVYDALGRRVKTDYYWRPQDSASRKTTHYTYDAKGNLIQEISCDSVGCFDKKVYTYDSRERLTEEVLFYPSGDSFKVRLVHAYNSQGRRTRTAIQEAHGPGLGIGDMVQEYDANGNISRSTTYYLGRKEDDAGQKNATLPHQMVSSMRYDANGNMIENVTRDSNRTPEDEDECGFPPCWTIYVYRYDFKGNWTNRKEFSCARAGFGNAGCRKLEGEVKRTITYYETVPR